jgi:Flp pilus assembly protein TadG
MVLIMPLVVLAVFATVDFGRLLNVQTIVSAAAREGARAESTGADPVQRAKSVASNLDVTVKRDKACAVAFNSTADAQVTVTHRLHFVTPVGALIGVIEGRSFGEPIEVTGKGTAHCRQ